MAARCILTLVLLSGAAMYAAPAPCAGAPLADDSRLDLAHVIVVRRGWHIDVGFAAAEMGPRLHFVAAAMPEARYIFFGFGDMHYLESHSHGASTLAAALWPGRGIMLVTGLEGTPQQGFGADQVIELPLSGAQVDAVQSFIADSFVTANGSAEVYEPGPYEGSEYFLAVPRYSALHTCNTWAAEALHSAPLKVHRHGVLLAGQLWSQVRRLAKAATADWSD